MFSPADLDLQLVPPLQTISASQAMAIVGHITVQTMAAMGVMADQAMVITTQATDQAMVAPAISRVAVALAIMGTGDLSTIDFEPHDTFQ